MNRGGFLKSLFVIAAAPKSLIKELAKPAINTVHSIDSAKYIAGYIKMSKQMMANLPFLQSVSPEILMRYFEQKENDDFINQLK